uniref:DUF8004 domain-containing protein n=2 Tax=Podospora anserina (strain S / ATCC MYA-4624 / DSM 980 / FGSC 10383) TaxID=515849 RepID=A0A090CDG6_PODAN|nr:Putative protein of unknown function [Podospora anserina S mat+]
MPVSKPPPQQAIPAIHPHLASPPPGVPNVMTTAATPAATTEPRKLQRNRSPSPEGPPPSAAANKLHANRLHPRHQSPGAAPRGRSVSAQPPTGGGPRGLSVDASRAVSNPLEFRADSQPRSSEAGGNLSPTTAAGGAAPPETKKKVRKSWLPGARSRSNSNDLGKPKGTGAWIMSPDNQVDYNVAPLFTGDKVPELWNEQGNVLVYLHPKERGLGPSFRVHDYAFSSSLILNELLVQEMMALAAMSSDFLGVDDAERRQQRPGLQSRNSGGGGGLVADGHLYLPLGNNEVDCLVAARNLFAFLTNQPLVGTPQQPTLFQALIQISEQLRQFQFTNYDGTSYGESVDASFDMLLDQFHIADVRHSREKTIEGLVLGEHMKSWNLYNEAFSHAVGKYESLLELKLPLYNSISAVTRERLERAHLSLANRQANVQGRLENFEYPSLFAGTASSTSNPDYRIVRFKEWRAAFSRMRTFVLGYYKDLFGSWPPKARSKKNHFTQSGLNRQCLKMLYSDLCALYDLLVDRQSITPRVIDQDYYGADSKNAEGKEDKNKPSMELIPACVSALRQMLSEFEKSSPPVLPPIPFDIPKIPTMTAIYETYDNLPDKKKAKFDKGLQTHELQLIMIKSRNMDTDALGMPFLQAYKEFELKEAKGVHPHDLIDHRIGHWLFLYVTLQSLPMLVVDAPGLHYTEGVEYFLCEAPQGNPPWRAEDVGEVRKMWYQTADQKTVELSADVVLFSVEGVYMRSHCWLAGKEWEAQNKEGGVNGNGLAVPGPTAGQIGVALGGEGGGMGTDDMMMAGGLPFASPLHPPRAVFADMDPFNAGVGGGHSRRGSDGSVVAPGSSQVRARSGSPAHRARHAYRASIAMGLEPLPHVGSDAPPLPGDRTSRVPSTGSGSSSPGFTGGIYGPGGLRASRSAVNLTGQQGQQWHVGDTHMGMGSRKSSYGGAGGLPGGAPPAIPAAGQGHSREGSQGGSTFDDILKGMDTGKKKKKGLFF